MNNSLKTSLVAVGACFSALVAVCTLQGSSAGLERSRIGADARPGSAGRPASAAAESRWTETSQVAHIIGDVLLPPNTEKAFFVHPVVATPN